MVQDAVLIQNIVDGVGCCVNSKCRNCAERPLQCFLWKGKWTWPWYASFNQWKIRCLQQGSPFYQKHRLVKKLKRKTFEPPKGNQSTFFMYETIRLSLATIILVYLIYTFFWLVVASVTINEPKVVVIRVKETPLWERWRCRKQS